MIVWEALSENEGKNEKTQPQKGPEAHASPAP